MIELMQPSMEAPDMTVEGIVRQARQRADDMQFVRDNYAHMREVRLTVCTQRHIAKIAGVSYTYAWHIERGQFGGMGADSLHRLVSVYKQMMEIIDGRTSQVR
jgi:hypothetical protein